MPHHCKPANLIFIDARQMHHNVRPPKRHNSNKPIILRLHQTHCRHEMPQYSVSFVRLLRQSKTPLDGTIANTEHTFADINIWRQAKYPVPNGNDDDVVEQDEAVSVVEWRSSTTTETWQTIFSTKRLTRRDSQEHAVQINIDRMFNFLSHSHSGDTASGLSRAASQRHSRAHSSNKSPFRHQESQRSIVSSVPVLSYFYTIVNSVLTYTNGLFQNTNYLQ